MKNNSTEQDLLRKYHKALSKAISHIFFLNREATSALKEAGSSEGIGGGGEMLQFVNWANAELEERGVWL